jgi:hypothetical protein
MNSWTKLLLVVAVVSGIVGTLSVDTNVQRAKVCRFLFFASLVGLMALFVGGWM